MEQRIERIQRIQQIGLIGGMGWESTAEYDRLLDPGDAAASPVPLLPTSRIHAEAAIEAALQP